MYLYQIHGVLACAAWPAVFLLVCFLGWRGRWGVWRTLGAVVLGTYAIWIASVAFFPLYFGGEELDLGMWHSFNLVPLRSFVDSLSGGPSARYLVRVHGGNLLLLAPFTLLGAILWPGLRRWWKALLVGLGASLFIELTQLALRTVSDPPYRTVDIDDVILNTIGALLGYGVFTVARAAWDRRRATVPREI